MGGKIIHPQKATKGKILFNNKNLKKINMEPKEKAKELVNKFQDKIEIYYEQYSNYFIKI